MTKAQQNALKWLKDHGGEGSRQGPGRQQILAHGEIAPFMWSTFKELGRLGFVEFDGPRAIKSWRVRLTPAGVAA